MKIFALLIPGFFLFNSCILEQTYSKEVNKRLASFPDSLTVHFPRQYGRFVQGYSYPYKEGDPDNFGRSIYVLYNIFVKDSLVKFEEQLKRQSYIKLDNRGNYILYDDKSIFSLEGIVLYEDTIPIPVFVTIKTMLEKRDTILEKLPNDFDVYVLETKAGKFLPDSLLIKDNIVPSPWEHGVSRGVAISEERQKAIVWLSLW